jgi:hypothetical protein
VVDAASLVCFDVRLVPNKGRLLLVIPSRRRGEMQLHRSIRRHASAKTDILQMAPIRDCSPSVGYGSHGLAEIENSNRIVSSEPAGPRTDGPIGETGHQINS